MAPAVDKLELGSAEEVAEVVVQVPTGVVVEGQDLMEEEAEVGVVEPLQVGVLHSVGRSG